MEEPNERDGEDSENPISDDLETPSFQTLPPPSLKFTNLPIRESIPKLQNIWLSLNIFKAMLVIHSVNSTG